MENRQRVLVIVVVGIIAIAGGFAAGALLRGQPSASGATPSPVAVVSEAPSGEASEPSASEGATGETSPTPGDTEVPSPTPVPRASVTFTALGLDAKDDPAGADRILQFVTGKGSITVDVSSISPQGDTIMCLTTLTKTLGCRTAASGRLSASTTKPKETFQVTLRGDGIAQPVVKVRLRFPAKSPSVTIQNARFDGTDTPDKNGITAIFTARSEGSVRIKAEWGGHPFTYRIDLSQQGQPGVTTYAPDEGDVGTDQSFSVQPGKPWTLVLSNTEGGFGVTPMTATLSWP
jgi:hypothetical protein